MNPSPLFYFYMTNERMSNMLSKNKIKFIHSLEMKKHRDETGVFIAEGNKLTEEALMSGFNIESLICTEEFYQLHSSSEKNVGEIIICDKDSIRKASLLQAPQEAMAIVQKPAKQDEVQTVQQLSIALDCIQDPGNLGTILRIADWFGIEALICSSDTVDIYNPKVVQASMGAIFRVKTVYTDLALFLQNEIKKGTPVYGTFLDGKNIYEQSLSRHGIIVMGNEGKGISAEIEKMVTQKLQIPSFAKGEKGSESLNVAVATAICCSEFMRRN